MARQLHSGVGVRPAGRADSGVGDAYFQDLTYQAEHSLARIKICLPSRHYSILALDTIPAVQVRKMDDEDVQ